MLLIVAACVGGCAGRGNVDLLESRLRQQQDAVSDFQSQLRSAQSELIAARRETDVLRNQLADRGERTLLPEQADALFRVSGIRINKLRTGGLDRDNRPGDDVFSVVMVPHDTDGEPVKLPGTIEVELFDLANSGSEQRIGNWSFDIEESHEHWHRGLFGTGYLFRLPLESSPAHAELVVHCRLSTSDGRQFDVSETITVEPLEVASAPKRAVPTQQHEFDEAKAEGPALFRQLSDETLAPSDDPFDPANNGDAKSDAASRFEG